MGKREDIIKQIKKFAKNAGGNIKIDKIIFFGSRASGKPHKDSDIDLIIVSNSFKGMNFFERVAKMYN